MLLDLVDVSGFPTVLHAEYGTYPDGSCQLVAYRAVLAKPVPGPARIEWPARLRAAWAVLRGQALAVRCA